jgi:hypothetical protein
MLLEDVPVEQAIETSEAQPPTPKPSYAPFFLALGITMIFWGLATSLVMSAGGFAVFAGAIWLWIRDIAQAWRNFHAHEA